MVPRLAGTNVVAGSLLIAVLCSAFLELWKLAHSRDKWVTPLLDTVQFYVRSSYFRNSIKNQIS